MPSPMGYVCQVCDAAVPEEDIEFSSVDSDVGASGLCPECGSWTKFDAFDDASDADDDDDMHEYNERRMREKWDDEDDDEDDSQGDD